MTENHPSERRPDAGVEEAPQSGQEDDTGADMESGMGGFDMGALLQQAQQMQEQMMSAQQELADSTVQGTVADGLVSVTVSGTGDLVGVQIRRDSFDPAEPEDLEDLIVAAYRDAKTRADALAADKLGPLAGALGGDTGPGGAGGPFGF